MHKRAKKIFASLSQHHSMYRAEIEYQGEKLESPYFVMNLEVLYPAMNKTASEVFYRSTEKKKILSVIKMVLSRKKLKKIPKDEHLFRLKEFQAVTIIDEYGKNLIEEAKVIGVEFVELEIAD